MPLSNNTSPCEYDFVNVSVPTLSIPPMYVEPPIPTPPGTINAPVVVDDDGEKADKYNDVPVAAPILGFTSTGFVANVSAPEPVLSEIAEEIADDVVEAETVPDEIVRTPEELLRF